MRDDLEFYARNCLKIRTKSGKVVPFQFNRAQRYIHERLEEQRARTGKVRALILKGRQQGCSTYIGARFYHRTSWSIGLRTFILTHEDQATQNLFEMVNRYHEHCPVFVRPSTGAANAKELYFDKLDSGYKVGTAGTKAVGRSSTIQLFHGSEAGFWPNADSHKAGVLQAIPDEPGTEVVMESTANGVGNQFHLDWQDAEAGRGEFIAIFVPWFWQDEYRKAIAAGFVMTEEEQQYAEAYGLDPEQIAWRRNKIVELKDATLFKQEYPATAAEAFQMSGHDGFIKPASVVAARKATCEGIGPLIIGADPARFGNDRFSLAWRKGRKVQKVESRDKLDVVSGANWIKQVIDSDKPDRVFIDVGGIGAGVYDILVSWGKPYSDVAKAIDFAGSPQEPDVVLPSGEKRPGPFNRRAEMWSRSKVWLEEPGGADIPDLDSLQADACAPGYHYNVNSYLLIESKEHMRDIRKLRSPDEWDAVALTFAEPVAPTYVPNLNHSTQFSGLGIGRRASIYEG
ncbi:hypothetical protein M8R20_26275 [Pseudomonas sp. R2.Fl]|nr:hypothetical protein [Pseudomonas sp. R2.Fl]